MKSETKNPRLTAYQKLKIRNQQLEKDIYNLVCKADQVEGITAKMYYQALFKSQEALMYGESGKVPGTSNGLLDAITQ